MAKPGRRKRGAITIEDVARAAGVSAMTVSRVINQVKNVRGIDARRRARSHRAAQLFAQHRGAQPRRRPGDAHRPALRQPERRLSRQFLIGALHAARSAGVHLVIESCEFEDADEQAEVTRRFATSDVEGVVLPPPLSESQPIMAELDAMGIPVVPSPWARRARTASTSASTTAPRPMEMTRYLLDLGHREIGFIKGHPNHVASQDRYAGFCDALTEAGLDCDAAPVEQGYFSYRSGLTAGERLLAREPRRRRFSPAMTTWRRRRSASRTGSASTFPKTSASSASTNRAGDQRLARADHRQAADRGDGRGGARIAHRRPSRPPRRSRPQVHRARAEPRHDHPRIRGAAAELAQAARHARSRAPAKPLQPAEFAVTANTCWSQRGECKMVEASPQRANMGFIGAIVAVATIGGFLFGYDSGAVNGTQDGLTKAFDLVPGSLSPSNGLGFTVGIAADRLLHRRVLRRPAGRPHGPPQHVMRIAALLFLIGALVQGFATTHLLFVLARICGGMAVGAASVLSPAYISEVAPASIRGRLTTVQQIMIITGLTAAFVVNYFLAAAAGVSTDGFWGGLEAWRWMYLMQAHARGDFPRRLVLHPGKPALPRVEGPRRRGGKRARKPVRQRRRAAPSSRRSARRFSDDHRPRLSDIWARGARCSASARSSGSASCSPSSSSSSASTSSSITARRCGSSPGSPRASRC